MAESVYKVIELVGTSTTSWEKAAAAAVATASKRLRDLRVAEVTKMDMHLTDGNVVAYRARVKVSFKYSMGDDEGMVSEPSPRAKRAARAKAEPDYEALPITPLARARKAKRKG